MALPEVPKPIITVIDPVLNTEDFTTQISDVTDYSEYAISVVADYVETKNYFDEMLNDGNYLNDLQIYEDDILAYYNEQYSMNETILTDGIINNLSAREMEKLTIKLTNAVVYAPHNAQVIAYYNQFRGDRTNAEVYNDIKAFLTPLLQGISRILAQAAGQVFTEGTVHYNDLIAWSEIFKAEMINAISSGIDLGAKITNAHNLDVSLGTKITEGNSIKDILITKINEATVLNSSFSTNIADATNVRNLLTASISTANTTLSTLNIAIANGDLASYAKIVDIKDNLTSTEVNKPLSANQGKILKDTKQDNLVGGTNIKTINGTDITGAGNLEITVGSGGYAANVYLTTLTSATVGTYNQISYTPEATETILSGTVNNNEVLLADYIFDGDVLATSIPAGEWAFHYHRMVDSVVGDSKLRFEIFKRAIGGTETVLFSHTTASIETTTLEQDSILVTQPIFTTLSTDRIGIKVYASTTRTSNTVVSIVVGDGLAAYFTTPLEIRHNQLRARDEANAHSIGSITNLQSELDGKHPTLVSGTNIKTINGGSILGSGDITSGVGKYLTTSTTSLAISSNNTASPTATGVMNVSIGESSGYSITTGTNNISLGQSAGYKNTTGSSNISIGYSAGGQSSGTAGVTGGNNIAIGTNSGNAFTIGQFNVFSGYNAGILVTSGQNNIFSGKDAGRYVTIGSSNIAIGNNAIGASGSSSQSGTIAIGSSALSSVTTGTNNTAVGTSSLSQITTGSSNTAVGYSAGYNTAYLFSNNTANNTSLGYQSGGGEGSTNICIGSTVGRNLNGSYNVVIGGALGGITTTTSTYSVCIGTGSLLSVSGSVSNTAVGQNSGAALTTGTSNTFIGQGTGSSLVTGSNNTIVGYNANVSAAGVSNEITLGNSSVATLRCQVQTITALSDARDKDNVENLNTGLNVINKLRPVSFTWNMRDEGRVGDYEHGFIAQELKQVQEDLNLIIPNLVNENNPDRLEASYGALLPTVIKAIQELSDRLTHIENKLGA